VNVIIAGRKADAQSRIRKYSAEVKKAQAALEAATADLAFVEQDEEAEAAIVARRTGEVTLRLTNDELKTLAHLGLFNVSIPVLVRNDGGLEQACITLLAKLRSAAFNAS
jgi:hypothetical protein